MRTRLTCSRHERHPSSVSGMRCCTLMRKGAHCQRTSWRRDSRWPGAACTATLRCGWKAIADRAPSTRQNACSASCDPRWCRNEAWKSGSSDQSRSPLETQILRLRARPSPHVRQSDNPPSISSSAPTVKGASSEARKTAAFATSLGSPKRPSGTRFLSESANLLTSAFGSPSLS